jgi:hypothetical protein
MPFTLIEGAMAMPRLRPLDRLPAPFGCDWALVPPHISLRAELKALYAAILRTFCVNTAAIHSLRGWDPRRAPETARASKEMPRAEVGPVGPVAPVAQDVAAEPTDFAPTSAPAAAYGSSTRWSALAGGACAVGGAAVLAWLAINHSPQHRQPVQTTYEDHPTKWTTPASDAQNDARQPVTQNRHETTRATQADSAPTVFANQSGPATSSQPLPNTRSNGLQARESGRHVHNRHHSATPRATRDLQRRVAAIARHSEIQIEAPSFDSRSGAKPSSPGGFSPFAPARPGVDEYASVTMSANTHLRDIAPARPRSPAANSGNTDSTDWMNHMSQRRVTEIREQFTK